jgi:hypothetical protein
LKGNFYHILLVEKEVPAASTLTEAIESILDSTLFRNDSSYIKATIQQVKEKRGIQA